MSEFVFCGGKWINTGDYDNSELDKHPWLATVIDDGADKWHWHAVRDGRRIGGGSASTFEAACAAAERKLHEQLHTPSVRLSEESMDLRTRLIAAIDSALRARGSTARGRGSAL